MYVATKTYLSVQDQEPGDDFCTGFEHNSQISYIAT